jgi:hypothetical protein
MTAFNRFTFYGYTLRPASEKDLGLATLWSASDKFHQDVNPDFWVAQAVGEDAYVLNDEERDGPLFFLKLIRTQRGIVELHIQFDHEVGPKARKRRREALTEGLEWLERTLSVAGIREIFFRSRNIDLILFAEKRLGFLPDAVVVDGETVLRKQVRVNTKVMVN